MDLELTGRRGIVTGGTRGIGRAIAVRLAEEGAQMAICARDEAEVEATVAELTAISGASYGAAIDVTDGAALIDFVDSAAAGLGGLDMLVASAGGLVGGPRIGSISPEDWTATLDLNVTHPATAARAAAPWLAKGGHGSMLIIGSIAGMYPWTRSHYGAAKAAAIHLTGSLSRELGPAGTRVNALSPGSILFPGSAFQKVKESDEEAFAAWERAEFPFGRLGTLDEVADVACFLLSDRASWVTGANVNVDGGQNPPNMVTTQPIPGRWLE